MALTLYGNVLSKISFCDKQCSNVNDNKFKSQIIENLDKKYRIQVVARDYNILNPNLLRNVSFHQHILATYTNGNPYMLYLTKIDNINCTIFIDKKLKDGYTYPKMHCVKYRFADELFEKDTIFTGELVRDQERRWFFLIDNILLYKGMNTNEKNILSRYELIHNIMQNEYKADKYLEICPLQVKKLFLYKDIKKLVEEFIPHLSYVCKGIVFYTLNNKHSNYAYIIPRDNQIEIKSSGEIDDIVQERFPDLWAKKNCIAKEILNNETETYNLCDDLEKELSKEQNKEQNKEPNKEPNKEKEKKLYTPVSGNDIKVEVIENNNVVFKVLKTDMPDIYNLYCLDENNNLMKHSIALVPNIKLSHYLYNSFAGNIPMKMECKYSKVFSKWTPYRFVDNEPYKKNIIEQIEEQMQNV